MFPIPQSFRVVARFFLSRFPVKPVSFPSAACLISR